MKDNLTNCYVIKVGNRYVKKLKLKKKQFITCGFKMDALLFSSKEEAEMVARACSGKAEER